MSNFYERQLTLLVVVCVLVLLLERWVSSKDKKPQASTSVAKAQVDDSLESGRSPAQHAPSGSISGMPSGRVGALNTLMRKYLTVYAIVMGASLVILSLS